MPLEPISVIDDIEWTVAIGIAREIRAALADFRWLSVAPDDTPVQAAIEARDGAAGRKTFEVDLLVTGTIQKARDRIRITVRLVDLRAGNQVVWARRFDRRTDNLHALQDEIAGEVAAQIEPEILLIETRPRRSRPEGDDAASNLVFSAIAAIRSMEFGAFIRAGDQLARAIALAPQYAAAYGWYAYWHVFLVGQGWADDPQRATREAGELAEWAVMLDPFDARCLAFAGHVWANLQRRPREAIGLHERALLVNRNFAAAWALSAIAYAYLGEVEEAEQRNLQYKRMSPMDPSAFLFEGFFTTIHLIKRDYVAAAVAGEQATQMNPLLAEGFKPYLAALGHLGRRQTAQEALWRLQAIEPEFSVRRFLATTPLVRAGDRECFAEGLRLAGVP